MLGPKATLNDYMGNVINGILDIWKTYMLKSKIKNFGFAGLISDLFRKRNV